MPLSDNQAKCVAREWPDCNEACDFPCAGDDFHAKLKDWRRTGSVPGYIGPRAGKDKQ